MWCVFCIKYAFWYSLPFNTSIRQTDMFFVLFCFFLSDIRIKITSFYFYSTFLQLMLGSASKNSAKVSLPWKVRIHSDVAPEYWKHFLFVYVCTVLICLRPMHVTIAASIKCLAAFLLLLSTTEPFWTKSPYLKFSVKKYVSDNSFWCRKLQ